MPAERLFSVLNIKIPASSRRTILRFYQNAEIYSHVLLTLVHNILKNYIVSYSELPQNYDVTLATTNSL